MDVLADVTRAISLQGALYFEVNASHPWISMNPSMEQIGAAMMPAAGCVIPFHIILDGHIFTKLGDDSFGPVPLDKGDVLILPSGGKHVITSDRNTWQGSPEDIEFYLNAAKSPRPFTMMDIGDDGDKANLVCGYFGCDRSPFNPLLDILPGMVVLKNLLGEDPLMGELVKTAVVESKEDWGGTRTMVTKLSEVMFLRALRQTMDTLATQDTENWLTALKDKHVGKVLELIHEDPTHRWTLASLSNAAGLSSSVMSEKFNRFVGEPPISYLTRWRMEQACRLLQQGDKISSVALEVGYTSESAFQRSFKKIMGKPAGQWKRQRSRAHDNSTESLIS